VTQVQLRRNHLLPDSASEISHFIGENNQRNKKGQKVNKVKQLSTMERFRHLIA